MSRREADQPKAYRLFEVIRTPSGGRKLKMRRNVVDRSGPTLEMLAASGDVISDSEIIDLFAPLGWKPEASDLRGLGYVLNVMRVTKSPEEAAPPPPELARVAAALSVLRSDLPVLIEMQKAALANTGQDAVGSSVGRNLELLVNMGGLLLYTTKARSNPVLVNKKGKKGSAAYWHRDLHCLMHILGEMAEKRGAVVSFTKKAGELSNDGRGVVLIDKMFRRAGVEERPGKPVTRAAIAAEARRHQSEELREYPE